MISYITFLCTKDPWEAIVGRIFKGMDSHVGFPRLLREFESNRNILVGAENFFFQDQREGTVASHSQVYSKYKTGSKYGAFVGVSSQLAVKLGDNWSNGL